MQYGKRWTFYGNEDKDINKHLSNGITKEDTSL